MSIEQVNPAYSEVEEAIDICIDAEAGQLRIKEMGQVYFPATGGELLDWNEQKDANGIGIGQACYNARRVRAVYPGSYNDAISSAIGKMHRKPPVFELPDSMECMMSACTSAGESLPAVLRRINADQVSPGRVGVLGDFRTDGTEEVPFLSLYGAKAILDWALKENALNEPWYIKLDETGPEMQPDFTWETIKRYRILALCEVNDAGDLKPSDTGTIYATAEILEDGTVEAAVYEPVERKGVQLDVIPFSFINSQDLAADPSDPPLIDLANLLLSIYRQEGDYKQNLHMQGQDTWVEIGASVDNDEGPRRLGAGAVVRVPMGGDAGYRGVESLGLTEQRTSIENDKASVEQKSGQLTSVLSSSQESGDALKTRLAAQDTSLPTIADVGMEGLVNVLRAMAAWFGATPESVIGRPNKDFVADLPDATTLKAVQEAKLLGAPISSESIHQLAFEQGLTKMSYEEEQAAMSGEAVVPE